MFPGLLFFVGTKVGLPTLRIESNVGLCKTGYRVDNVVVREKVSGARRLLYNQEYHPILRNVICQ